VDDETTVSACKAVVARGGVAWGTEYCCCDGAVEGVFPSSTKRVF
jgi:protein involved in ribonucleotide reduction